MSQVVVAGLVLSEVERKPMQGLSPFLGGCWPWHSWFLHGIAEDIQVHPQVAFPTHFLRTVSWDSEPTLSQNVQLKVRSAKPLSPIRLTHSFQR